MEQLATQITLIVGVLGTVMVGPFLAGWFLAIRKKRRRDQRRSPISIDLLRSPGHTVREELEEVTHAANGDLLVLCTVPLFMLAFFLAQSLYVGLPETRRFVWFYVVLVLGLVVFTIRKLLKLGEKIDRLRAGFDAELAVGQELDKLMRQGAIVFHDFPGENFNIDHIVIAPQGVFAVETKGYTKPTDLKGREGSTVTFDGSSLKFPMWTITEPLEQAERQAEWLAKWLASAVGAKTSVIPVVALPGGS
jgi:hypothetical protein